MAEFTIYIGNKNYSSWSLRGWLMLQHTGAAFDEIVIPLEEATTRTNILRHSPSGKVPALRHGEAVMWETLAIGEYLAELFPKARLWPEDPVARAFARSIAAEMHSGFRPLRDNLSMALLERHPGEGLHGKGVAEDIARIEAIWTECRERWGRKQGGPFLFGHFTVADAMYAPIATRFRTYMPHLMPVCMEYVEAVLSDPDFLEWEEKAISDPAPELATP